MTTNKVPITIITGFLGAGKTSLLNHVLTHIENGQDIAVIVNDFGQLNLDAQLIVDVKADVGQTIELTNGCICCTIKGELVEAVRDLATQSPPPRHILLETSGVSDPIDVVLALRMIDEIRIDAVITVVDGANFMDLAQENRILAMNQVGTADLLALTKTDLINDAQRAELEKYIHKIAKNKVILDTPYGAIDLQMIFANYERADIAQTQSHAHETYQTWYWVGDVVADEKQIRRFMMQLPDDIYRVKAIVPLSDTETAICHKVGKRIDMYIQTQSHTQAQWVFIGKQNSIDEQALAEQLSHLADKQNFMGRIRQIFTN